MKTKITALALIAVIALSVAPKSAEASDKTLAVIGGFIGGMIVASELNHSHDYYDRTPAVVVNDRCGDRDDRYDDCDRSGYWREVSVRVWVPGYWVTEYRHDCAFNRYVGGHYECRNDRVWVTDENRGRHGHHERHDREIGYGYGHRR